MVVPKAGEWRQGQGLIFLVSLVELVDFIKLCLCITFIFKMLKKEKNQLFTGPTLPGSGPCQLEEDLAGRFHLLSAGLTEETSEVMKWEDWYYLGSNFGARGLEVKQWRTVHAQQGTCRQLSQAAIHD